MITHFVSGSKDGAMVRTLAFNQCVVGAIPALGVISGLLLVQFTLLREVFLRVLPLLKKNNIGLDLI